MEIVDQIRQTASIVEIASAYTTLKRRGKKSVGLCPFHSEKTPSFTVDDEKQLFHCFGCGAGGDVFSLVMQKENLSFPEALKFLAEKYHITLPQQVRFSPQALKLEEKLFKINEMALAFFRRNLFHSTEGQKALLYLKKRNLAEHTIEELKIGYALNTWNSLFLHFKEKNAASDLLEKAGLALPGKKKDDYYDRFRGRIIFPIFNLSGKTVAFGGRTIFDAEPKYLNSPETPVYSKGKLLYGLNFTKDAVREKGELILVEGYIDFIALYQAGIKNCAASLGTSLTSDQVNEAKRFAQRVLISYDGDSAGKIATSRGISICFEYGIEPKVLILPENLDPDSFLEKYGAAQYQNLLEKRSISLINFLIDHFTPKGGIRSVEEKVQTALKILSITLINPDTIIGNEYLKKICERLGLNENIVRSNLRIKMSEPPTEEKSPFLHAEKRLLQILFEDQLLAPFILTKIREDDFRGLRGEPVFRFIQDCFKNEKKLIFQEMQQALGPQISSHLSRMLLEKDREATREEAWDCLQTLRKITLQNRLKDLQAEITRLEKAGEKDKLPPLLHQRQDLTKQILSL